MPTESESVERGYLEGPVDLRETMESGQVFRWRRTSERPVEYTLVYRGEGLILRQRDGGVEYESTGLSRDEVRSFLGLDVSLPEIESEIEFDERVRRARDAYPGLRVVDDEFFPCLVSFVVSANNRIPRIHDLVLALAEAYGTEVPGFGHSFPSAERLANATETELRDLGLGYRAPYVLESARMIADGEFDVESVRSLDYHDAHEELQRLVGVGPKVADCVMLFSLDYPMAVPLDTWMEKTMERHYPDLVGSNYRETTDAFRERFGRYSGYAQNYLFHYIRRGEGRPSDSR
ncbi:MAG: DNA-3-methyladenine glycosylase family protein [Halobacteriales archaeon]